MALYSLVEICKNKVSLAIMLRSQTSKGVCNEKDNAEIISIACTAVGVLTSVAPVLSVIRVETSLGILMLMSVVLLFISITLPFIIRRTKNIQMSKMISMIDENLSKANTLLPSILKYVLRSKSFKHAINDISVDSFVVEFEIGGFNTQNRASVHVNRLVIGHAPAKCRTINIPFTHSQSKNRNEYTYNAIDKKKNNSPMLIEHGVIKNIESISIVLSKQISGEKDFSVLLSIEDGEGFPSFCNDNRVQAFIADPSFLFSSWKSTKFIFKTNDLNIRNRVGRLFYINRNTYSWTQRAVGEFDSNGELCFDLYYNSLGKQYRKNCFVVLLERV